MENMNILIIEDNQAQNDVLANFLRKESYTVFCAYTLEEAKKLLSNTIALIVLDVMLPDGNGLEFLKEIREKNNVPVIVLTALDDEYTQMNTFDLCADEYVSKPVSPIIMTKRIIALLNRIYGKKNIKKIIDYTFDFNKYIAFDTNDNQINMTTKEMEIIKHLFDNEGNIVTRESLIIHLWGYEYTSYDRSIDTHIKNIRKKLKPEIIITVKNIGYRINI